MDRLTARLDVRQRQLLADLFGADIPAAEEKSETARELLGSILRRGDLPRCVLRRAYIAPQPPDEPESISERIERDPKLLEILPLSKGARRLVLTANGQHQMLKTVFADRAFKDFVSSEVSDRTQLRTIGSVRAHLIKPPFEQPPLSGLDLVREPKPSAERLLERIGAWTHVVLLDLVFEALLEQSHFVILIMHRLCLDAPGAWSSQFRGRLVLFASRALYLTGAYDSALAACTALREMADADWSGSQNSQIVSLLATAAVRSGRQQNALDRLEQILVEHPGDWQAHCLIGLILAAQDAAAANVHYEFALKLNPKLPVGATVCAAEARLASGQPFEAHRILDDLKRRAPHSHEYLLGLGNVMQSLGRQSLHRRYFAAYFEAFGLSSEDLRAMDLTDPLQFGRATRQGSRDHPLVTVAISAFNAANTILFALQSVQNQTMGNLEIIVVDDCSTDETVSIVRQISAQDPRVKLLTSKYNAGAHSARNRAIEIAKGHFFTCHDADDWMHPERIGHHLQAARSGAVGSASRWIRMDRTGRVLVRLDGPYLHHNPSSLFVARSVFDNVGYFDSVRAGADSEMRLRIQAAYGSRAIRALDVPLGIGLHRAGSLTTGGPTAYDPYRFSKVRLEYAESWCRWQVDELCQGRRPHIDPHAAQRPFPIPAELAP